MYKNFLRAARRGAACLFANLHLRIIFNESSWLPVYMAHKKKAWLGAVESVAARQAGR